MGGEERGRRESRGRRDGGSGETASLSLNVISEI